MPPFPSPRPVAGIPAQRGAGLLQALLLVVLVGAATVAGLTLLRASKPADQAGRQEDALRWADEALVAFAAANAHLPCPVSSPGSAPTDCVAPGQKGWLPTRALEAVHPGGAGPATPLRYVVYRGGADSDLAQPNNTFSPHRWDRTQHALAEVNGLDFCAALGAAARATQATPRLDLARTLDASGTAVNIAYGLVAAGPTAGLGGRFDGVNQGGDAMIAPPSLATTDDYDDRTRARGFGDLGQSLGCGFIDPATADGVSLASVDMLALAVDVSDEVNEQHEGNREETQLAVAMASVSTVFAGINVALAGASVANSASTLATASSQLSAAIASCAVLVGCGLIPPYTAAVIAGGVAVGLAAASTGLAAGALVPTAIALGLTVEARDMAEQGLPSATIDLGAATERTCIAAEGGFVSLVADANGNLTPVDPPQFRAGLLQELQATEAELATLRTEVEATRLRIVELEQIPSVVLIDYPPEPVRFAGESDADFNARYQAWLDSRRDQEAMLQAKLEAIRRAKTAEFDYESARQTVDILRNEVADIDESVRQLTVEVAACDASPPANLVDARRCENNRRSLLGLTTCDANILTARQVLERQCQPWKRSDLQDAIAARDAARATFEREELAAVQMPEPPIKDYIGNTGWFLGTWDCTVFAWCDPLIVYRQSDNDKRETYAKLVYRQMGYATALAEKQAEVDEKRAAYDTAQAQCDALRALNPPGGASGTEAPPVWAGAEAIMQAANCRGATGAITPSSCGAAP